MDFRKIRYYHLYKQNLIQKSPADQFLHILKNHTALHSTDYVTPYLSIFARTENFQPELFFNEIKNSANAIRLRAFRGTVFIVHRQNLQAIFGASNYYMESRIREVRKFSEKNDLDLEAYEREIDKLLSPKKSLTVNQIKKLMENPPAGDTGQILFRYLEFNRKLIRTSQRYITDPVIQYGLTKEWAPEISLNPELAEQSLSEIISSYIKKFGPVCLDDICWWFPISKSVARQFLKVLKKELTVFELNGRDYFMDSDDFENFTKFDYSQCDDPVINFLPYEDHFPKAYKLRDWYVNEAVAPQVFHVRKIEYGQLRPSIWVNGEIVGRWEMKWIDKLKSAQKVDIVDLNLETRKNKIKFELVRKERERVEKFINEKLVPLMKKPQI